MADTATVAVTQQTGLVTEARGWNARAIALLAAGVIAGICSSNFLLDLALRGGQGMDHIISELAADGQPNATLLRVTDVVCAVLALLLALAVRPALRPGPGRELVTWGAVTYGAGAIGAALVHSCAPGAACVGVAYTEAVVHNLLSVVSEAGIALSMIGGWWATRRAAPAWFGRWAIALLGVMLVALAIGGVLLLEGQGFSPASAYMQRLQIMPISGWLVCLGVLAAQHARSGSSG